MTEPHPHPLTRRAILRAAALGMGSAALAAILAACGTTNAPSGTDPRATATVSTPPTVGPPPPAETVTASVSGDTAEKNAYERLVAAFNERQSRVKVALAHVPSAGDYTTRLTADLAAGTPADIVLLNYRRFGVFAAKGAFEPLTPYLAASSALKPGDFFAQTTAAFTRGGQLYGLPQNASNLVVYYNTLLFERGGIAPPGADWTWDDFLAAARGLTRGTEQYGVGIDPQLIRLAPFVWQNNGDIVDDIVAPTKLTLDRPESLEAVQWFVDLQVRHRVAPDVVQASAENDESRFLNGRSAMFLDSRRFVPTLRELKTFDWDVAPLPQRKSRASILHSDAYFLTAASRHKAAAFAFMEFANSPEGQTIIARTGRTVPSLRAVAESPAFLDPATKPTNSRVFLDAIPVMRPTFNIDTTEQIEGIVNNELKRAFYGQTTVADAIATATTRTAPLFKP